ncbi:restriction endonuclease PLD domain-containing protein [Mycoplasma wenyonii]|uniref:restriction endonuclease PLD domain-containing protein n=1 Tax=Mycoplasma wenyonii TaxID=65123 RepID=UPI00030AFD70|nr:restriction endonuclease PLD domain-containing protein [Mycoplasma wenyonii]
MAQNLSSVEEESTFLVTYIDSEFAEEGERVIDECFWEEMEKADRVEIFVAYCGYNSLGEINQFVKKGNIKNICLILGMYFFIGFGEAMYKLVMKIHTKWQRMGVGEIRLLDYFPNHGKLYCFYKNDHLFSAIIGSPNLSFLIPADKDIMPTQCEMAELIHKPSSLKLYRKRMEKLRSDRFSRNMTFLERYKNTISAKEIDNDGEVVTKNKITYTKNY